MANEVANKASSGALAAANALKGNLQKVRSNMPETRGAGFMSFGKDGIWTFGQSNEEVFLEDVIAINPMSIETGFICWSDRGDNGPKNEVLGEVMVKLGGDVPLKHTLPSKEDDRSVKQPEWREQYKVQMRFMTGPHKGTQVTFATTSLGGIDAVGGLIDQIMLQLDDDPANIVPLCSLTDSHYMHKKYGKTYTPVIKITDWASLDEQAPDETAAPEADAEETPETEAATETPKRERQRTRATPAEAEAPKRERQRARVAPAEVEDAEVVDEAPAEEEAPQRRRRR